MARYPNNWSYGVDGVDGVVGTGDITNRKNIAFFAQKKYDIITSDCGQATVQFGMQEEELMEINYCQIATILLCLRIGGNCLFKTFLPMALPLNISILAMFYKLFKKIIYFKPSLNPSSSEVYICGIGYNGGANREMLLKKHSATKYFYNAFDKTFIDAHFSAIEQLSQKTQDSITRSLLLYYNNHDYNHNALHEQQTVFCEKWLKKYYLSTI